MLTVAGSPYRPFPRGGWDMAKRFSDMDAAGVDVQVVSNTPQTFLYNQEPALTAALAALQNDQIAAAVAIHPERLMGIATLPMQAPQLAADELRRSMRKLGLKGAQIGSNINGRNLDNSALEPLWAAADELAAFIMVHPTQVAGAERLKSYYLTNLIGNPLDTTIAAACLVFGGVVGRYPRIKFLMVHGGGFVPYQAGRFRHGWQVRPEPQANLKAPPDAALDTTLLRHHRAFETGAGVPGGERRCLACAARQRLSLRHGHARLRAAGAGACHPGRRQSHHPRRRGEAALVGWVSVGQEAEVCARHSTRA